MKKYLLGLLCLPGMMFSQILTVSNGASISIENTASLNLSGLTLAPSDTYVISDANAISVTDIPVVVEGNTSVDRVYDASTALSGFTGTITFAYDDDELNDIPEADLVLETLSTEGVWTNHPAIADETNNTLSYAFTDLEFTKITASSANASLTIVEIATNDFVKVYPNPTTDKLIIVSKNLQKSTLYNVSGQKVLESDRNELNVSELPTGVYLLHTTNKQNQLSTFKIIKK
jgi:hypothetical protein